MPTYVYGCSHREHTRIEVVHGMIEDPVIVCNTCGETMHRVPQAARHYNNPLDTLAAHMDKRYREWRLRRKKGLIRG